MKSGNFLIAALVVGAIGATMPVAPARADSHKARITGLTDVSFGSIAGTLDRTSSQNVCAFTSSHADRYSVTANGGVTLSSGAAQLPYDVLWADSRSRTDGTALAARMATAGFRSNATQQNCGSGPSAPASLTVVIRSAALMTATAGDYSGTLQIAIAPE